MYHIFIITIAVFLFNELYWKRRKLPNGPTPLPLLGNLLPLVSNPPGYDLLQGWKNRFGPVYTYWLGVMPVVTVNDWQTIKETFIKDGDVYADRKSFGNLAEIYRGGTFGLVDTSGCLWREQRRFTVRTLRSFGLGGAEMQRNVLEEAAFMLERLEEASKFGDAIQVTRHLERAVCSVNNLVLFGKPFDDEVADEFQNIRAMLDEQQRALANPLFMTLITFAWLRHFPGFTRIWSDMLRVRDVIYNFFQKQIEMHKMEIDYKCDEASDFCYAYLKEMRRQVNVEGTTFSDDQLVNVCLDLWFGGMETTSSTLGWALIFLIHNPEVQENLHAELDREIGTDRLIDLDERNRLHYMNAFINETQRCANIVPQNLLRTVNRDVVIAGHLVRAGATISPQISMLLYDPKIFPEPSRFDPTRFLDANGHLRKFDQFVPFSVGKRQCIGERFARMELFLFLANLLRKFQITAEDKDKLPSMHKTFTNTKPMPFKCILTKRKLV